MSGLTKEQLRNELVNHGIELPSSNARKSEYVELYEKHVAPVQQSKGDFSSDEEDLPNSLPIVDKASSEASFIVDGIDVSRLSDDDLYSRLQEYGATVGPIVDTTRKVYQKKLVVLMGGTVEETATYNGDVDQEDYSDSEEEVVEEPQKTLPSTSTQSVPVSLVLQPEVRKRTIISTESERTDLVFDPELHTPSPRRSLRTVTSTSTSSESYTSRKIVNNGRSGLVRESVAKSVEEEPSAGSGKVAATVRLLVKLIFLALILVGLLFGYQYLENNPTESPFKPIEQLARQALEAAVGEEEAAKVEESVPIQEEVPPAQS
ncbi:emerin homolog 1-like isoform X1 [Penaeus monodon]|uniref:emerin homolog 1-like isoform X1 n=1 Tax=Penaeus monodon TaxID=6687 RepID=UPI0018A7504D|nr:emerin homolog 1-like isoform X1 [Penaeus monodon]